MGLQAAEEPGAFRQAREPSQMVLANPEVEGPLGHALDRVQQPERDEFAGPERLPGDASGRPASGRLLGKTGR